MRVCGEIYEKLGMTTGVIWVILNSIEKSLCGERI